MKRILLISYNFSPEPTGIGKYNGEMIEWLVNQGYDCTVVTSYPYYPFWKVQEPYTTKKFWYTKEESVNENSGGTLTIHRCPQYVPSLPSGPKRILLDFSFFLSALLQIIWLLPFKKHDLVITVAPSFQVGLLGVLYKTLRGSKLVYHIQDLQIEAARDLKMIKSARVIKSLLKLEKFILNKSDVVSSISEGMVERIRQKAHKDPYLFPNWTDTSLFFPIENKGELKKEYGFNPEVKIALYSGAIGEKQGLEAILHAANEFKNVENLKFIICGSGPYKEKLQNLAKALSLENVIFLPLQPFEKLNRFLNLADLHLVIQKSNASDLVMPSKLSTILSVGGLALITANKGAGLHSLVNKHNMGLLVDAEDQTSLNDGIRKVLSDAPIQFKKNAREYAETHLSIQTVMNQFNSFLLEPKKEKVLQLDSREYSSADPVFEFENALKVAKRA